MNGYEMESIAKHCYDSVFRCDIDSRKDLLQNVIMSGGNTLFEGMGERMW